MMDENINESAEIQEVAEPEDEALESAETQEVAEPDTDGNSTEVEGNAYEEEAHEKSEADAAFAEMRRNNQALERSNRLLMDALSRYFEGETAEELSDNAIAYATERDPDEYRAEREQREEFEELKMKNQALEEQMLEMEIDRRMQEGLREVQEINPNVKSLDELGESFVHMIAAGLSTKEAYFASLQMESKEKVKAPDPIGRASDNRAERDYFTSEEIDNMDIEELATNDELYEKVVRSMERLYGKK